MEPAAPCPAATGRSAGPGARGAWAWTDGVDAPLGEQAERYDVTFGYGAAALARWEPALPELTIPADVAASLLAQAPTGVLRISQRGDRAGSLPLELSLT